MTVILRADTLDQADPQIWAPLQTAFAEALGLEEDEVELHHRIIDDLGAESLDFLDIAFRLERAFDIRIPRGGIETAAREELGDEPWEHEGVLTDRAIRRLAEVMPEIPADEFVSNLKSADVPNLFRVATFYNLVVHLLAQKAEQG